MKDTSSIYMRINGTAVSHMHHPNDGSGPHGNGIFSLNYSFKRGDTLQMTGQRHGNEFSHFTILKTG